MNAIRSMRHNQFLRHNAVFFFGSIAVGALNYAYYPIIGRMLKPAAFGEVQTLVSLFLQLSIFLTVLSMVVVNIVTNYQNEARRNALVFEFEKLALVVALAFLVLTTIFQRPLQAFFNFESSWPFVLLALTMVVTVPFMLRGAYLRGKKKFGLTAGGNLIGAGAKIVFSAIFVALGLGTTGAIGGIVLAQSVACGFVVMWALRLGLRSHSAGKQRRLPNMRLLLPELSYGACVLVGSLVVTLQYSIDVVVIKHYFDAHTAGLYAGVAAVARVVFFVTASISQVHMSSVKMDAPTSDNTRMLVKSLILLTVIGGATHLALWLFPEFIIKHLMGGTYLPFASLLPRLSFVVLIVSILNVCIIHYLALRRYSIAFVTALGFGVTCALMAASHATPAAVVNSLLYGSLTLAGLICLWVGSTIFNQQRREGL